ncbi:copper oxidase [Archangium violaceum]|uniref:copper oxidase n=1 Tax=Archangium violaceum TaxID=83451 RepID=UPI002B317CFD|nr:copper oxidase [Archangium gephyra]
MSWAARTPRTGRVRTGGVYPFIWAVLALTLACQQELDGNPDITDGSPIVEPAPRIPPLVQCHRVVTARVVALDQVYTYNRFGSYNPTGMIYALRRDVEPIDASRPAGPGNARLRQDKRPRPLTLRVNVGDCLLIHFTNWLAPTREAIPSPEDSQPEVSRVSNEDHRQDSPFTRKASVHVQGMQYINIGSDGAWVGRNPGTLVAPGQDLSVSYYADHEGSFLLSSKGALIGGEGNGGSLVQGLFGAVNVEPPGARWYRSQVSAAVLQAATRRDAHGHPLTNPDGTPRLDYEARGPDGTPLLNMLEPDTLELVHADLHAIITGYSSTVVGTTSSKDQGHFREFTVLFHDELKTVQAFEELETNSSFHGLRDGFAINYGASGLGAELLANRARIGPTKDCGECQYEEFFLESWANGDPALNVEKDATGHAVRALYPDDPSNVDHSYLGDPVRFRNLHAGPKETHVFHLHAHQWKAAPGEEYSSYLDSQTIGPGSSYTYDINYGGSGNRNLTPGDAIYHCHLYPHFAQGMWALWRVHDVFEAGTGDRRLPDGEITEGTPSPAVVPIPERGMPPLPTYVDTEVTGASGPVVRPAFPGYPFYIAARAGHRPPQPPLDLLEDGGLPRHLVTRAIGPSVIGTPDKRFFVEHTALELKLLPQDGTPPEKKAMSFHAGQFPGAGPAANGYGDTVAAYPAYTALGSPSRFLVNGRPPSPGAPYADPCPTGAPRRDYRAAYLQMDLPNINRAGWHDPQARLIVLDDDVADTLSGLRPPEPFFFRAESGECINFFATNLVPKALEQDDFQIYTPTDTIGQHIHLVKFDVTSSDGAGNGWNYEDGTFAAQEVLQRIEKANVAGGAFSADGTLNPDGTRETLTAKAHPRLGASGAQTTVQRWWADPLQDPNGRDRTVETVFTHDHFAPSSHQQHGLYGALIVEPKGSRWRDPRTGVFYGTRPSDGGPTSWQADILTAFPADSYREFALAIADFALAYDECGKPVNAPPPREAPLPLAILPSPFPAPEAISAADPGTMVINYRNEPIPLRISAREGCGARQQRPDFRGEMANVFRSDVHGDPFTPLLRGYVGDRVKLRLIQGAQEEQHSFTVHGHKWLREEHDRDSGFSNAQPLGLSEHFEFALTNGLPAIGGSYETADYMYQSSATGDLWNGTWGILRTYLNPQTGLMTLADVALRAADGQPRPPPAPLLALPPESRRMPLTPTSAPLQPSYVTGANGQQQEQRRVSGPMVYPREMYALAPELVRQAEAEGRFQPRPVMVDSCPGTAAVRTYQVSAIDAATWLPGGRLTYNEEYGLYDPDALLFVRDEHLEDVRTGVRQPEPLILRARAGECVQVTLTNLLPEAPRQTPHWSHHPPITPFFNVNQVRPSNHVSLHPQLVNYDVNTDDGANVGLNAPQTIPPGGSWTYRWYAGDLASPPVISALPTEGGRATPVEYGIVNLRDMADVVNHGMHGSIGALVIEPSDAVWSTDADTEAQARVRYTEPDGTWRTFREFVLLIQDELGLHTDTAGFRDTDAELNSGSALRNLSGEDDAEDTGMKAFNYRTEPIWARLGVAPQTPLEELNDREQSNLLSSKTFGDPATPVFRALRGEALRLRIGQPSGHARQHAFALHGAEWRFNPWARGERSLVFGPSPLSPIISTQGGISAMQHWNIVPEYGAGGLYAVPGDYLYQDLGSFSFTQGLWGIVRVE